MTREPSPEELRRRAEERVSDAPSAVPDVDVRRLVHELEVHQVELELQNEELRAARLEVEEALRRYTELFDFAPVGYLVVRSDGAIQDVNFAAARLLGRERGRLLGRNLAASVARPDLAALGEFLRAVAASEDGAGISCALTIVRPGAPAASVRATGAVLGRVAPSMLVALEDVTARARAEEALRREGRRKDEFLAALSHELRNPLAPIQNGLTLLSRAAPESDQARRALAVVERQVTHLGRIVDDLLDVTRIARGKIRLHRERLDLGALVRSTVEDHRAAFEASGVALDVQLPLERCWVDVDATRTAQVLGNLLGNAAKFTRRGDRVDVAVRREPGGATVSVRDSGMGIAPEVRERLFEPFAQAPQSLERSRGGLGLGLAMVKGLVELHGGSVGLRSEGPGRGAEFSFRLPLADPPALAAPAPRAARAGLRRVLVIDDNADGAYTLKDVLELSGHDVRVALSGPEGLALARAFSPAIVLCDIGLPGMDGYAVARALRADPETRDAYLVALTGYALPEDQRRASEAGFDRHLAKPVMLGHLERILAEERPHLDA